jgi:asparagine synthase (glutamine-hydrolysing)
MCGIFGLIGSRADHDVAPTMLRRLRHRGPDGEGIWRLRDVSLGSARLKIIDLSDNAAQPMTDPATGRVLTFNGEIYNYRELARELSSTYEFRTRSDTEVILAAFARWGDECVKHLRGMFALALWDPARHAVFMARDRFGIKPLYVRSNPGSFMFASEIKAVVNLRRLDAGYEETMIASFLCSRLQDTGRRTMFAEVTQVLPSERLWVDESGSAAPPAKYWQLPPIGHETFDEAGASRMRDQILESVSLHTRADVQVGCLVSGGLDSSSIACSVAHLNGGRPLHTFSSVLADANEENALIPDVERAVQAIPHHVQLQGDGFLDTVRLLIRYQDEPIADASMYAHFELMRLAREADVRVVLSGNGGDELFGGYSAHLYAYLGSLARQGRLWALAQAITASRKKTGESGASLGARALQEAMPNWVRAKYKAVQFEHRARFLLNPAAVDGVEFYFSRESDPVAANFENSFSHWTIPPFLHYEDRNGMAFGVEVRTPFIDHVIVEACARYFSSAIFGGLTKSALRQSMVGIVPAVVLKQTRKFAFAAPLTLYLRKNLREILAVYMSLVDRTPFLHSRKCVELGRHYAASATPESEIMFWRVLTLAIWYHEFFVDFDSGPVGPGRLAHGYAL